MAPGPRAPTQGAALTLPGFVLFFVPFLSVFSFCDGLSSGAGGSGLAFRDFPLAFVGFFLILAGQGRRAVGRQGLAVQPQIRVRCTARGYLETEDARFCSGCGASMFPS